MKKGKVRFLTIGLEKNAYKIRSRIRMAKNIFKFKNKMLINL